MQPRLRRASKTLAFLAAGAGALLIATAGYVLLAWDRPVHRPPPDVRAPRDPATLARGRYLYQDAMLCWTCHGSAGSRDPGESQAGGRLFDLSGIGPGFGKVWGSNLTSDPETGVGKASDGELLRAIREGVDQRGQVIFPVMAYQFYRGLSDDDALAIVAYIRTFAPVRNRVPSREPSFAAKALIAFGMIRPEDAVTERVVAPPASATVEYGRYVAWHASGCAECHTPRFPENGQLDRTRPMAGGLFAIPEAGFAVTASNLTPDQETGLGRWTEGQFVTAVRAGTRPNGTVMLPFMPWPVYARWSDLDVRAVWLYLRSITAVSHPVPPPTPVGDGAGPPGVSRGAGLFDAYCVTCHGERGRGGSFSSVVLADFAREADGQTLTSFILDGPPAGSGMPGFGKTLTPGQVKDIVAYLKSR